MGQTVRVVKPGRSWRPVVFDEATCEELARRIIGGVLPEVAARGMGVPPRQFRKWMAEGEEDVEEANDTGEVKHALTYQGRLYLTVQDALHELAAKLAPDTKSEWLLERMHRADYGSSEKVDVDVTVSGGDPIRLEGRAGVLIGDVLRFLHDAGQDHALDIRAGAAGDALPAARDVLPDPAGDQRPAGELPPPG